MGFAESLVCLNVATGLMSKTRLCLKQKFHGAKLEYGLFYFRLRQSICFEYQLKDF